MIINNYRGVFMDDYLSIQKIWQDIDFAEYRIIGSSPIITATSAVYLSNSLIDDLSSQITRFLNGSVEESCWVSGKRGNDSPACLSLRFLRKDRLGHIFVELYMELDDDGGYDNHNCCFFISTEYGLLLNFCNQLPKLKQPDFFSSIKLNESSDFS